MNKVEIEELNRKAKAQIVVNYAMNIFNCKTTEKLKEICYDIIDTINYLNN